MRLLVPILTYLKKKVFSSNFWKIIRGLYSLTLWFCPGGGDAVHTTFAEMLGRRVKNFQFVIVHFFMHIYVSILNEIVWSKNYCNMSLTRKSRESVSWLSSNIQLGRLSSLHFIAEIWRPPTFSYPARIWWKLGTLASPKFFLLAKVPHTYLHDFFYFWPIPTVQTSCIYTKSI